MELESPDLGTLAQVRELRPTGPYDVLDVPGVMSEMLHISDERTLSRLIAEEGLPVHRVGRKSRLFVRGEVLDWIRARCTSTTPDQKAAG